MSKFEKAKSVYLSISFICMLIYVACGILAGIIYAGRHISDKLQSRKAKQQLEQQMNNSAANIEEDEVVEHLKAAGWDYV